MIQIGHPHSYFNDESSGIFIGIMREELIEDIESFYDEIAAALAFPEYFGRNLDALADMLNDLEWIPCRHIFLICRNSNTLSLALDQDYDAIMDIFSTHLNERLQILMVD